MKYSVKKQKQKQHVPSVIPSRMPDQLRSGSSVQEQQLNERREICEKASRLGATDKIIKALPTVKLFDWIRIQEDVQLMEAEIKEQERYLQSKIKVAKTKINKVKERVAFKKEQLRIMTTDVTKAKGGDNKLLRSFTNGVPPCTNEEYQEGLTIVKV
jgi:hypothetical protein